MDKYLLNLFLSTYNIRLPKKINLHKTKIMSIFNFYYFLIFFIINMYFKSIVITSAIVFKGFFPQGLNGGGDSLLTLYFLL